jgi:hypothetical protein
MSFPKLLMILVIALFGLIGVLAWMKQGKDKSVAKDVRIERTQEIEIQAVTQKEVPAFREMNTQDSDPQRRQSIPQQVLERPMTEHPIVDQAGEPDVDRIDELFNLGIPQLPIVETITYRSKVSWLQDRQAWIADYASYYGTSRHFIARSLNKKPDYLTQKVQEGDRFNVFRRGKDIRFYLLLDISRCKMWFYSLDGNDRVLLKTYKVGLGRLDNRSLSGCLTPVGKYTLGSKVAIFTPGTINTYNGQPTEMIRVFGTRWIPFDKEMGSCSAPAKGYGIHGVPWNANSSGVPMENRGCISKYDSDGCVRLTTEDMEEIFSIIITKPVTIEIVKDVTEAHLPGKAILP